jgi:acid-sensing ion channel, other
VDARHSTAFVTILKLHSIEFILSNQFLGDKLAKVCEHTQEECISNVFFSLSNEESQTFKSCNCLPACNSIEFDFEVIEDKMVQEHADDGNLTASALIYFGDVEYFAYKRYANYGAVTFLSNIGGLLGLFLGISMLSLIETIYFFTLRFIDDLWYKGSV